jgi:hypothetical protein
MILSLFSGRKTRPHVVHLFGLLVPLLEATKISGMKLKQLAADQFVAGYIAGVFGAYVVQQAITDLGYGAKGRIQLDLEEQFGTNIFREANRLANLKEGENPDFDRGYTNGLIVSKFSIGDERFERIPVVLQAIEHANMEFSSEDKIRAAEAVRTGVPAPAAPKKTASRAEVQEALIENLFLDVVRKRFG